MKLKKVNISKICIPLSKNKIVICTEPKESHMAIQRYKTQTKIRVVKVIYLIKSAKNENYAFKCQRSLNFQGFNSKSSN